MRIGVLIGEHIRHTHEIGNAVLDAAKDVATVARAVAAVVVVLAGAAAGPEARVSENLCVGHNLR
jgi:hypothetical protein